MLWQAGVTGFKLWGYTLDQYHILDSMPYWERGIPTNVASFAWRTCAHIVTTLLNLLIRLLAARCSAWPLEGNGKPTSIPRV